MNHEEDFHLITNKEIEILFEKQLLNHWMVDNLTRGDVMNLEEFLPSNTTQVVDLCCGSGRVSIGLDKLVTKGSAKFWLVDGEIAGETEDITKCWDKYSEDRTARFYNKKDLTEKLCSLNNFSNYEYIEVDENLDWSILPKNIDFLFSIRGIGCHWPLKLYEEVFPKILRDGAICLFMNHPILGEIPDYFSPIGTAWETVMRRPLIVLKYTHA
jgi:SAM-dependent methyltransferase